MIVTLDMRQTADGVRGGDLGAMELQPESTMGRSAVGPARPAADGESYFAASGTARPRLFAIPSAAATPVM